MCVCVYVYTFLSTFSFKGPCMCIACVVLTAPKRSCIDNTNASVHPNLRTFCHTYLSVCVCVCVCKCVCMYMCMCDVRECIYVCVMCVCDVCECVRMCK